MKLAPRVRYSQFNAEDIKKELLQRYELEQPLSCRFYDFGMNDIYLIRAGNTNYYLRISLAGIHQRIDYLEAADMVINKKINLDRIATDTFKLDEFKEAFEYCKSGQGLKVMIEP